jgi:hypothetical protein
VQKCLFDLEEGQAAPAWAGKSVFECRQELSGCLAAQHSHIAAKWRSEQHGEAEGREGAQAAAAAEQEVFFLT